MKPDKNKPPKPPPRDDIKDRLRRIRDLLLGREPGPLTQIDERLVALALQVTVLQTTADQILTSVGQAASERATHFDASAETVPATPPVPPADKPSTP